MQLLDRWIRRPRQKVTYVQAMFIGGLLLFGGCSGGDYEDRFKKSMDNLKTYGSPTPPAPTDAQAPAAGDQPAGAAQPPTK